MSCCKLQLSHTRKALNGWWVKERKTFSWCLFFTTAWILVFLGNPMNVYLYLLIDYLFSLMLSLTSHFLIYSPFIYSFYFNIVLAMLFLLILTFVILGEILCDKLLLHFSKIDKIKDLKVTYILHAILYFVITFIGYLIIGLLN